MNKRLRLKDDEFSLIQEYRERHKALAEQCELSGIPIQDVKNYWFKSEKFSINAKVPSIDFDQIKLDIISEMQKYSPSYPTINRSKQKDACLYVIDPSDPHFGKYASKEETGNEYNLDIAISRYSEGIEGLMDKASSYNIEKIVFIGGNDSNHVDNPFSRTTSGTHQDLSGMWYEGFNAAKNSTIKAIEKLLTVADVHFVHCPSNHDYITGFFLAQTIQAWFRNSKNVTFDVSPSHRKYIQYGNNLIGCTHGDGAPEAALSDLMKTEAKMAWSVSDYAYWYVHHIHHKDKKLYKNGKAVRVEKDGKGLTVLKTGMNIEAKDYAYVEYLRSISGTDSWHHKKAFQHSFKAMEGFIHHPIYGQVNRITHLF
jgi:hypothetical protein